jgi:hypothetical protein
VRLLVLLLVCLLACLLVCLFFRLFAMLVFCPFVCYVCGLLVGGWLWVWVCVVLCCVLCVVDVWVHTSSCARAHAHRQAGTTSHEIPLSCTNPIPHRRYTESRPMYNVCSQCNDKCENQHTIDRTNEHVEQHNMHKHQHHRANTQVQLELNLGARSVAVVCVHCGMFKLFVCSVHGLMVIALVVAL